MARYSKNDRVNRIIEMVSKDDNVTISYLADYFSVSHMTIRRDVEELQNNGVVKVIFGGQIVKNFIENSPEYSKDRKSVV